MRNDKISSILIFSEENQTKFSLTILRKKPLYEQEKSEQISIGNVGWLSFNKIK